MPFVTYRDIYYSTFTVYRWQNLFNEIIFIEIILETMKFLSNDSRWVVYAFVIMPNHVHLFYQVLNPFTNEKIKHSFLSFTAKRILLKLNDSTKPHFLVNKFDRKFQIWKSPSLSVEITSPKFVSQKMNYIHDNPRRAGLVKYNADYPYCSYASYEKGESMYSFLSLW
ncbi:MAG: transposase [Saprospiraceae bacterium]|nr:transposase [Saprospiraceae bacterium]